MKNTMLRPTKDKAKALKHARLHERKVLWKDNEGLWHSATDRHNTPGWATETEDVTEAKA
jgi:hypothetical protein